MKKDKTNDKYNSDITEADLQALGERTKNIRTDNGDDGQLNSREKEVDFAGKIWMFQDVIYPKTKRIRF